MQARKFYIKVAKLNRRTHPQFPEDLVTIFSQTNCTEQIVQNCTELNRRTHSQFPEDLVTFTGEILNGKLHFFV